MRACILPRRAQPASSTLRPPLPARLAPRAQLRTLGSTSRAPLACADPPRGHARTPRPRTLAARGLWDSPDAASTHPHPDSLGHILTLIRAHLEGAHSGKRGRGPAGGVARDSVPPVRAGALQVQDPLTPRLTRQPLVPGSRTGLSRHPAFPAHWAGWAPGQGGSGLEGWAAAPHPQTPARSQLLQGAKRGAASPGWRGWRGDACPLAEPPGSDQCQKCPI